MIDVEGVADVEGVEDVEAVADVKEVESVEGMAVDGEKANFNGVEGVVKSDVPKGTGDGTSVSRLAVLFEDSAVF